MNVNELIAELQKIADNGGGEAVTTCYALQYWSDDVVTFLVGTSPLVADYPQEFKPVIVKR